MRHVLYLHGFLSSPRSLKAQQTLTWCQANRPDITLHIPQVSNYPSEVATQLDDYLLEHPELTAQGVHAIGSSMGGFLSTWLVEKYGGKAVLINPAVRPFELLIDYIGEHTNPYTREPFAIVQDDIAVLTAMNTGVLNDPSRYMVLLQTADATLDYRQAEEKYAGSQLIIEQGGDHSFVGYETYLPTILAFLTD